MTPKISPGHGPRVRLMSTGSGVGTVWWWLPIAIGAEILMAGIGPAPGLWLHALLLVLMSMASHRAEEDRTSHLFVALALLSLVRIVATAVPPEAVPPLVRLTFGSAMLLLATVIAARAWRYSAGRLRCSVERIFWQVPVAFVGLPVGFLCYSFIDHHPITAFTAEYQPLWAILAVVALMAISEEFYFRGLLLSAAADAMGPWPAIALVGLAFGIFHLPFGSWEVVVIMVMVGWLFSWYAYASGSLVGVSLAQVTANIVIFIVLPMATLGRSF